MSDKPLRILYFSCHEILEYDDLKMLTDLGHTVFSIGHYSDPIAAGHLRRPDQSFFSPDDHRRYLESGCTGPTDLRAGFVEHFDVAIVNHHTDWVHSACQQLAPIPIVYRSIGQSSPMNEAHLSPLRHRIEIVRYSQREVGLPGFQSADRVIYFGKYLGDFEQEWVGGSDILTFHNNFPSRSDVTVPNMGDYDRIASGFPVGLWGLGNDAMPQNRGLAPAQEQSELYKTASLYLYAYSAPPSYTLSFMEAMAAGVPILAPSASLCREKLDVAIQNDFGFSLHRTEIESLLGGRPEAIYHSIDEARSKIQAILSDPDLAKSLSSANRNMFEQVFSAEKIKHEWDDFLRGIVKRWPYGN